MLWLEREATSRINKGHVYKILRRTLDDFGRDLEGFSVLAEVDNATSPTHPSLTVANIGTCSMWDPTRRTLTPSHIVRSDAHVIDMSDIFVHFCTVVQLNK